jgi:SAM-dependent methyltransferase
VDSERSNGLHRFVTRIDYEGQARVFRRARTLPPDVLAAWSAVIAALAPAAAPCRLVIDLGAGPGGFLAPLQDWFGPGAAVLAVEPSAAMRSEAAHAGLTRRYPYVAAWAESLPVRTSSVDLAWLSTVIHQFDDRVAAARELRRVVRAGGRVLVRGFFSDVPVTGLLAHFPGIERSAATFPSTDEIGSDFAAAGFGAVAAVDVIEPWRFELDSWSARIGSLRNADSALRPLTDDEITRGIAAVRDRYATTPDRVPGDATIRLLALS